MRLNLIISVVALASMFAMVTYASVNYPSSVSSGVATTSIAASDDPAPARPFFTWSSSPRENIFDAVLPWGENATYAFLEENGVIVASTTLRAHTPFSERFTFTAPIPADGYYEYDIKLCGMSLDEQACTRSAPLALVVQKGVTTLESDLDASDQTTVRIDELHERSIENAAAFFRSAEVRLHGLSGDLSLDKVRTQGEESNLDRIRRIISSESRRALFAPTNNISRSDLYAAIARFPAFCNESSADETLDVACTRELAAVIAYISYFTSHGEPSLVSGMRDPGGIERLLGNDVARFDALFPAEDDVRGASFKERIREHPSDALLAILWWYMTPQSPEPDPHSALLGIWIPSREDSARGIAPGFGATVNIMSHGKSCARSSASGERDTLSALYHGFLLALHATDTRKDSCLGQEAFDLSSSSFAPQYWSWDADTSSCVLGVTENAFFVQDEQGYTQCMRAHGAMSPLPPPAEERYDRASRMIDALRTRIGTSTVEEGTITPPDPRTALGTTIIGTYRNQRVDIHETQPATIPYAKLNTLFYEGAYVNASGTLALSNPYAFNDMPFSDDCYREDCPRGLAHRFLLAHGQYPHLQLVLSIGGWDGSNNFSLLSNTALRESFISSVRGFLLAQPDFTGIDISWMYPQYAEYGVGGKTVNDRETMREIVRGLRNMLDGLYQQDGMLRRLYVGVGALQDEVDAIGLSDIVNLVDGVHLITYDLHGPWEQKTGHDAQLFATNIGDDVLSVANAVTFARKAGVPSKKLIIGIPYYGRIWRNVPVGTNLLLPGFQVEVPARETASLLDYRTIAASILGKGQYQYYVDALRGAAYLYDGTNFVSYDAPDIIARKMEYVWREGFGGVLLSDVMGDDGTLQDRVLRVIAERSQKKSCTLTRMPTRNLAVNSRGADVFALQTFLACLGDMPEYIDINGNYGQATQQAVMLFEKAEGLPITGVVGKDVRDRLQAYMSSKTP